MADAAAGRSSALAVIQAMRVHQWVKNLLVFVPILLDHKLSDPAIMLRGLIAFVAFCLAASGGYVVNDLMDLEADRNHPAKRERPFASSALPAEFGMVLAPLLLLSSVVIGATLLPGDFLALLLLYIVLTISYSAYLKRIAVLDVLLLAGLYTLRVLAGVAASGVRFSTWLLAFAMFLFLSLAFVKRYTELFLVKGPLAGRGYIAADDRWLPAIGISCGYMAVLVLTLYVNAPEVTKLYANPAALWWLCPLLLFWVTRRWFRASREISHDDPVIEALRDPATWLLGVLGVAIFLAAI